MQGNLFDVLVNSKDYYDVTQNPLHPRARKSTDGERQDSPKHRIRAYPSKQVVKRTCTIRQSGNDRTNGIIKLKTKRTDMEDEMTYDEYRDLEKLGDAVLRVILTDMFFGEKNKIKRSIRNGRTTRMQSNAFMDVCAKEMGIEPHSLDKSFTKYANALEVKIGQAYRSGGIKEATELVKKYNKIYYENFE